MMLLNSQVNLANAYKGVAGGLDKAICMERHVLERSLILCGPSDVFTLHVTANLASTLICSQNAEAQCEAKALLTGKYELAAQSLGPNHPITLTVVANYTSALNNAGGSLDEFRHAIPMLENSARISQHVLGPADSGAGNIAANLHYFKQYVRNPAAYPHIIRP